MMPSNTSLNVLCSPSVVTQSLLIFEQSLAYTPNLKVLSVETGFIVVKACVKKMPLTGFNSEAPEPVRPVRLRPDHFFLVNENL